MLGLFGKKDFRENLKLNGYKELGEKFFGIFFALVSVVLLIVHTILFFIDGVEKKYCIKGFLWGLLVLVSSVGIIIDHLPPQICTP